MSKTRSVAEGVGQFVAYVADLFTATPFDMTTVTIHRDQAGKPRHVVAHKECKAWPGNEALIEITDGNGVRQGVIYTSAIPSTKFWRDMTVAKLTLPVSLYSDVSVSIAEDKLVEMEDAALKRLMVAQNKSMRFTPNELQELDVPVAMLLSSAGFNTEDTRSQVVEFSVDGQFDTDAIVQKHIEQDPHAIEFYYCSRAARLLVDKMRSIREKVPEMYEGDAKMQKLWRFVTSQVPTYEAVRACRQEFAEQLAALKFTSSEVELFSKYLHYARIANEAYKNVKYERDEQEELENMFHNILLHGEGDLEGERDTSSKDASPGA